MDLPVNVLSPEERRKWLNPQVASPTTDQAARFEFWRRVYFANKPVTIEEWFQVDGGQKDRFIATIDLDKTVPVAMLDPPWLDALLYVHDLDQAPALSTSDFSQSLLPFLSYALREIAATKLLDKFVNAADIRQEFVSYLARRLQPAAYPATGLAFHFAKLTGAVKGTSDKECAATFLNDLQTGISRRDLLRRFPVTDRILAEITSVTVAMFHELIERLTADADAIQLEFSVNIDDLSTISFGAGDPHIGGRCVCDLHFGARRILYKPKSLQSDIVLSEILGVLNGYLDHPLALCNTIARQHYGWVEPVQSAPCSDEMQVRTYFYRIGAILAVHYATGATDVHFENIIANGAMPIVVDTETIVQLPTPRPARTDPSYLQWLRTAARNQTVLGVGMLPNLAVTPTGEVFDLSGTGSIGDQVAPFQQPRFEGFDDGKPSIQYQAAVIDQQYNLPVLNGKQQSIDGYSAAVLEGFSAAYAAFLDPQAGLMSDHGPIARLSRIPMRWVARPTTEYALTLRGSYDPSCLRDGYERDVAFSVLLDGAANVPSLIPLLPFETRDLWQADIPYFKTSGKDRALLDGYNQIVGSHYFDVNQPSYVRSRLDRLCVADLSLQKKIIGGAIAARCVEGGPVQAATAIELDLQPIDVAEIDHILAGIEEELSNCAVYVDGLATWATPIQQGVQNYTYDFIDWSLYGGVSGIGLFYAEYARRFKNHGRSRAMAENILVSLETALEASRPENAFSAFEGLTGTVYAAVRMAKILNAEVKGLSHALENLEAGLEGCHQADVISGRAGIILALRCLLHTPHRPQVMKIVEACAHWLSDRARIQDGLASWESGPEKLHLTGFAHGACGVAVALDAAGEILEQSTWRNLARQALDFEQSTFDPISHNWKDQRPHISQSSAWCHGAPGLALARVAIGNLLPVDPMASQLDGCSDSHHQVRCGWQSLALPRLYRQCGCVKSVRRSRHQGCSCPGCPNDIRIQSRGSMALRCRRLHGHTDPHARHGGDRSRAYRIHPGPCSRISTDARSIGFFELATHRPPTAPALASSHRQSFRNNVPTT